MSICPVIFAASHQAIDFRALLLEYVVCKSSRRLAAEPDPPSYTTSFPPGVVEATPRLPSEEMKTVEVACAVPASSPTTKYPFVTGSVTTAPEEPMMEGAFEMESRPVAVREEVATDESPAVPLPYSNCPDAKVVWPVPPRSTDRVPVVFERATLREEVATQLGRPVVYELERKPPVLVASAVRAVVPPLPKRSCPSVTEERPVPPEPTPSAEARVSAPAFGIE